MTNLAQAFGTYFQEIDRCLAAKCHWSLLHLLVVLPAVCAALETPSGEAGENEYKKWCRRYFDRDARFTSADRYAVRVALVHQGRTTADDAGQYRSYSFVPPSGRDVHLTVRDFGSGHRNLTIDVGQLASETKHAMERWFKDIENADRLLNIDRNVRLLARQGEAAIPSATGVIWNIYTTSSTGGLGP